MNILFVEDSETLANLFRVQLQMLGDNTLTTVSTKDAALAAFKGDKFDLVFVDMGLEGIQERGLEVLVEIKASVPDQRIGILSSNDQREMVRASQQAGAEFYMIKPFTIEVLALVLDGNREAIQNYQPEKIGEGRVIAF
jgi:two-component system chemotaxis response regulator CheY